MRCPKCGQENTADAVICAKCDFILDTSFLGEDILDDQGGEISNSDSVYGGDAVILGPPGDEYESFVSDRTGEFLLAPTDMGMREVVPSQVYVDEKTKALFDSDAVLAIAPGVDLDKVTISPFEAHVINFIDGHRPVARVRTMAGLGNEDLRICLAMLSDKGVIARVGTAKKSDVANASLPSFLQGAVKSDGPEVDGAMPDAAGFEDDEPTDMNLSLNAVDVDDADVKRQNLTPNALEDLAQVALEFVDDVSPSTAAPHASPFSVEGAPIRSAAVGQQRIAPNRAATATTQSSSSSPSPGVVPMIPGVPSLPGAARAAPPPTSPRVPTPPVPTATPVRTEVSSAPKSAPMSASALRGAVPPGLPRRAAAAPKLTADQEKAKQVYDLAIKDIQDNKMSRALSYARLANQLDPTNARYKELVDNWQRAKDYATALEFQTDDVKHYVKAQEAEAKGDYEAAVSFLQKAIEVKPDEAQIHNQMGVILATRMKDHTRALTHLFRACELAPANIAYKNNLGKVLAMSAAGGELKPGQLSADGKPIVRSQAAKQEEAAGLISKFKKKLF